jgi:hypothetical protein
VNGTSESDQLLAALTLLKDGFGDPDLKAIFKGLIDQFCPNKKASCSEAAAACKGKPASAKPAGAPIVEPKKPEIKPKPAVNPKSVSVDPGPKSVTIEPKVGQIAAPSESDSDADSTAPAVPKLEICNSSTHRREHARLARRMQSDAAAASCPEMVRLWNGSRQDRADFLAKGWKLFCHFFPNLSSKETLKDKSALLKQWIESGENLAACESRLVVSKSQEPEMVRSKELLTIRQMVERGYSQQIGPIRFVFLISSPPICLNGSRPIEFQSEY